MKEWEAFLAVGLIMVGALVFTPTSDIVAKILQLYQRRFGLQPELTTDIVSSIACNGTELNEEQTEQFIRYFNESNFLYYEGFERGRDVSPIQVHIQLGSRSFHYSLYRYDDKQIQVARHKKGQDIPYRISSVALADWLLSMQEVLAV